MKPTKQTTWNDIDAFGLLNGIGTYDEEYQNLKYVRLPGETNLDIREKINRMHENPIYGTTTQDLINGLSNELQIDTYNIKSNNVFILSKEPYKENDDIAIDIIIYYKEPTDNDYLNTLNYSSDDFEYINIDDNYYGQIIKINKDLENNTYLKIEYYIRQYDENNNEFTLKYTDFSNENDDGDEKYLFKKPEKTQPGDNYIYAYNLDNLTDDIYNQYYDDNDKPTPTLYKVKNIIDKYHRYKWKDITNGGVWDINTNFSKGVIKSFYDYEINIKDTTIDKFLEKFNSGFTRKSKSLFLNNILYEQNIDNDTESWNAVIECGDFILNNKTYSLFENPQEHTLTVSEETSPLFSIDINSINSINIEIHHDHELYIKNVSGYPGEPDDDIYRLYDYELNYNDNSGSNTYLFDKKSYRYKPYINTTELNMTQDELEDGEYTIDYIDKKIYINDSDLINGDNLLFVYDKVDVKTEKELSYDINPMNNTNNDEISKTKFFMCIEEGV